MEIEQYQRFTNMLTQTLEQDERSIALVALGSMAEQERLDRWSDHDFWIITSPGSQDGFLTDLSWLPNNQKIALSLRQAERYQTVVYNDGHIAEFAVFAVEELPNAKTNAWRVLFDKEGIAPVIEKVHKATMEHHPINAGFELGNFVLHLWVGLTRYRRGETLSSHKYVTQFALEALLFMLVNHVPPREGVVMDNLDERRRFETAYPQIGRKISGILSYPIPDMINGLLDIADDHLSNVVAEYPFDAAKQLRIRLVSYKPPK